MQASAQAILNEIYTQANPEKAAILARFFKTGPGEYGEGDSFIGLTVPQIRSIAKRHHNKDLPVLAELLASPVHEVRLTALLALVYRFEKAKDQSRRDECARFYIEHLDAANNWDLVDLTCYKLLGPWLIDYSILHDWARSGHLWRQRVAIVTCMYRVRRGDFSDAFAIADILLHHPHDLIHKAVGWILREAGKKDEHALMAYLLPRYRHMPRTMLRYAIERFEEEKRQQFLQSRI